MKSIRTIYILAAALILQCGVSSALAAEYIVVVHPDNPVNSLTPQEAKRIFLGKKMKWADDEPITIVMNTNDEIHEKFTRTILHKSPIQLSVYWKKILYSGTGMLPLAVKDDEAVKSYIGFHTHAIGYISEDSMDKQVKKVEIQ